MMPAPLSPGSLAQLACVLEASARKPGNVHRFHDFADTGYLDFMLSALAIGPALDRARAEGVGTAVLEAIVATRRLVATNTNLGMILLLAPLAAVPDECDLHSGVQSVLSATTIDDARSVYQAIRLARPGALGSVSFQDVVDDPTVSLLEAMRLAAERDSVARQYANGYADVFGHAVPCLTGSFAAGRTLETSIVLTHLSLLARLPDTLILRKRGREEAAEASRRAAAVLDAGWPDHVAAVPLCDELDRWLRAQGHSRNPGTTADLVSAALFAALRDGTIQLPIAGGRLSEPTPGA
jgi:triphosphoribosyl-dephospho-CoA synthase